MSQLWIIETFWTVESYSNSICESDFSYYRIKLKNHKLARIK